MTASPRPRNIALLYGIQAMSGALMALPIIVLFLQEQGLSLRDVFLLQTVFAVTLLIGEIPTGYVSDRWGRKPTLVLGTSVRLLGILAYCVGGSFWAFCLAEVLGGIGHSFLSGSLDAFAYDTLLEKGNTAGYRRIIGQSRFWFFATEGVGSLLGGILGSINLRWPFWATILPFGISIVLACCTREPRRHKLLATGHIKAMWTISIHALFRHRAIQLIIILHAILATLGLSLFWFTQPYQSMVELPVGLFGLMHGIIVVTGAIASKYLHTIERWMDDRLLLIVISAVMVGGFFVLGTVSSLFALAVFPLVRAGWAFATPLTTDMVNRMADSSTRATVLSVKAFGQRLLFAIVAPFLGYAADLLSLQAALLIASTIGGVSVAVTLLCMRGVWKEIPR